MALTVRRPPDRSPGLAGRPGPSRWTLRAWRLALAGWLVVTACAAGLLGVEVATPPVPATPGRVAAILAAHGAPSDGGTIPERVATALLATEDSRFYSDTAIDPQGVARAAWGVVTGNPDEGGATIELQLAKLAFTPGHSDAWSVAEQVGLAFKLDDRFSKSTILAMYLDAAYFGDGAYGIVSAAHHYFGLAPDQLSWGQASLLAGLVQAPTAYDPHGHLSAALRRRRHVLARMVAVGDITAQQSAQIQAEALNPAIRFSG